MFRWWFSGDGGYPRSIVAGLYAGGGGFLRSTVAALASGKEAHSALSSPAFGHGEWRLAKLRAAVLEPEVWVRGPSRMRSRLMMKLSGNGEDVQEEDSTGSRLACLGQSGVKTERRRMTMVSLEAIQSLSSGETRLSMASSGGCAKRFRSSRGG
ncbi:hypothetical protein Bca4012_072255 [Brassica carinata]